MHMRSINDFSHFDVCMLIELKIEKHFKRTENSENIKAKR